MLLTTTKWCVVLGFSWRRFGYAERCEAIKMLGTARLFTGCESRRTAEAASDRGFTYQHFLPL